jgi:hypothetical protein
MYYVVFMITGDLLTYAIGLVVEAEFGAQTSLIVFLVFYFFFLWLAWILAVRLTEPKAAVAAPATPAEMTAG